MATRHSRPHAGCLALLGALGGLLLLSPACNDASDRNGEVGAPGGEAPAAGTGGSNNSSSGSAAGGAASGATNTGGAAELGGAPAGGSDGDPTPMAGSGSGGDVGGEGGSSSEGAECETSDDCLVFNDCCSCEAIPKTEQRGECERLCIQSACSAQGLDGVTATCRGKRCVFDLSCDRSLVTCKVAEPVCDEGKVPSVEGTCYGPCISAAECSAVTDCKDCAAGQVCVTDSTLAGNFSQCVEVSSACAASPTCECTDACDFQCSDTNGIGCFCVACN